MNYMEPPKKVDYKDKILKLPIATNDEGDTLYHSLDWANKENIVVIEDDEGKEWIRGKGLSRYRVIPTWSNSSAVFTVLKSGRRE